MRERPSKVECDAYGLGEPAEHQFAAGLVYSRGHDAALVRLGEIKNNVKARRDTALILANSSYALRRVNRSAEAKRRIDEALAILKETKDYPSDRVALDSELCAVLQARGDQHADEGRPRDAAEEYEQLLERVMTAKPDIDNDLRDAYSFALINRGLARLHRLAGANDKANAVEARTRALWAHWNRKLPSNPFVLRRLAQAQGPSTR